MSRASRRRRNVIVKSGSETGGINALWKEIVNYIVFIRIPIYAVYSEEDVASGKAVLPIKNGKVDEKGLNSLKLVGRSSLEIARLAMTGVPIQAHKRDDALVLYKRLDKFLDVYESIVKLPNFQGIPEEDLEAVKFLAESIVERQINKLTAEEKIKDAKVMNLFTPGNRFKKGRR